MANIKRRSTQIRHEDHGNMAVKIENWGPILSTLCSENIHVVCTFARRLATFGRLRRDRMYLNVLELLASNFDRPVGDSQRRGADRFIFLSRGRFPDVAGGADARISPL